MDNKNKKKLFFKIPQNFLSFKLNMVLVLALFMIVFGILAFVAMRVGFDEIFAFRHLLFLVSGIFFIFIGLAFVNSSHVLFVGIFLVLCGIMFLLMQVKIIPLTMKEMWPMISVCFGLALIPTGLVGSRRVKAIWFFPSLALIFLGVFFFLFSAQIIHVKFTTFVSLWWPMLLVLAGFGLLVVFFIQQFHRTDFNFFSNESGDNADEE